MLGQYIVFGIILYFLGLFFSGVTVFIDRTFVRSIWLFVCANVIGFFAGAVYILTFFGQSITFFHFDWFFHFAPRLTPLSSIFFILISGISAVVGIYSTRYIALYEKVYNPRIAQFLMAFFVLGMQGVIVANNTFAFLFFWEVMSITSFFLVFVDRSQKSISAAFLYFIMTHLGASAILGGFLVLGEGTLFFELTDMRDAVQSLSPTLRNIAFLLFVFGFGSKAGLVPFHVWLPEAHPQAPSNISALMSGLMLKVAIYGFITILLVMQNVSVWIGLIVLCLGALSSVVGVLYAIVERDMKRAFAYSSIENMGIIFMMLGLAIYFFAHNNMQESSSILAMSIVVFALIHAISHALFKTALFLSSGLVISRVHTKSLDAMGGVAKIMPLFTLGFLIATLGALPIPPFGTFYGEWGFVQSVIVAMRDAVADPQTMILLLSVVTVMGLVSGLAIFAMIRIFGLSMLGLAHHDDMDKRQEQLDYVMIIPIIILGCVVLLFGVFAKDVIAALTMIVRMAGDASFDHVNVSIVPHMSVMIGGYVMGCVVIIFAISRWMMRRVRVRSYHTWDCGQPIDATMQYSATAFSAPIRFFFLTFIGRKKFMKTQAVISSNPWIVKNTFVLSIRSKWSDMLYAPIARALLFIAEQIRFVQNGRIQYYVLFLLLALILTLIFAL